LAVRALPRENGHCSDANALVLSKAAATGMTGAAN